DPERLAQLEQRLKHGVDGAVASGDDDSLDVRIARLLEPLGELRRVVDVEHRRRTECRPERRYGGLEVRRPAPRLAVHDDERARRHVLLGCGGAITRQNARRRIGRLRGAREEVVSREASSKKRARPPLFLGELRPPALQLRATRLLLEPPPLGRLRRLRRLARPRLLERLQDQQPQPLERRRAVPLEAPILLRLDHDDAVARDALIPHRDEPRLAFIRQRRAVRRVEPQMRGARDLVHVLSAGALRADGRELYLVVRDLDLGIDAQAQGRSFPADRFTTSTTPASPSMRTQSPVSMMSSGSRSRPVTAGTRITTAPSATFVVISLK